MTNKKIENNIPKVAILMSTYNGEKYIRQQIDSILTQIKVDVYLYIRDDGSSDSTINIIEEYIQKYPNKVYLNIGKNIGAACSFMDLVYKVADSFDYYAFSDQDDVWFKDKLIAGIKLLRESNKELYLGNLICVDKDLKEIGLRNVVPADISPYGIMVMNKTNGCTMIFSNKFHTLLSSLDKRPGEALLKTRYHDTWVAMVGAVSNNIVYDFEAHMLYRQHENNVVGATDYFSLIKKIKIKLEKVRNKSKRNGRSWIAREIIRLFPDETKKFPYLYVYANAQNMSNKLILIRSYNEYKKHGSQSFIGFTIYTLLGLI